MVPQPSLAAPTWSVGCYKERSEGKREMYIYIYMFIESIYIYTYIHILSFLVRMMLPGGDFF